MEAINKDLLSEKVNDPSEMLDTFFYYFQKGLLELESMHSEGIYHADIRPMYIQCNEDMCILESKETKFSFSPNDLFVPPEIALGTAVSDGIELNDAIHSYQTKSPALELLSTYCPTIATQYTAEALKSIVGKPMPANYSDCWSYGMSFLYALDCMKEYNKFYVSEFWKNDSVSFFECLQSLLCLKSRKIPTIKRHVWPKPAVHDLHDEEYTENSSKTSDVSLAYAESSDAEHSSKHPPTGARCRMMLARSIHHGAHNKTRKAPRS
jgi:hypothetical protein